MRGKTIAFFATCVLWIGIGIGKATSLFLVSRPVDVLTVCASFFCAGAFFVLGVRTWRQSAKAK